MLIFETVRAIRKTVLSALECLFPTIITDDHIYKFRPLDEILYLFIVLFAIGLFYRTVTIAGHDLSVRDSERY